MQVVEVQKENARLEALNAKLVHVHATPEHVEQAVETRQLLRDHEQLQGRYTALLQERHSHNAEHQELQEKFAAVQEEVNCAVTIARVMLPSHHPHERKDIG